VGHVISNKQLDFGDDPVSNADPGILKAFSLPLQDRVNCTNFADSSRSCRQILMNFLKVWDVSLETNQSILKFIRITILTEFFSAAG